MAKPPRLGRSRRRVPRVVSLEARINPVGGFTDLGSLGLSGVFSASSAWGDYDGDGDLDALLIGNMGGTNRIARVYRNDSGSFTDINAGLTGVDVGSTAWGDHDNDGDLDILMTGRTAAGVPSAAIYRNNGGTFTDIAAGLTGVRYSSVAWGDYDNDGDLDVLLAGRTSSGNATNTTRIYRNGGSDNFTEVSTSLPGLSFGSLAWSDYDNDGDLDILLSGTGTTGSRITSVFRNDGNSVFTDISAGLLLLNNSSTTWGDYDNDGDLDILITGQDGGGVPRSIVYRNDAGVFTNINASLTGVFYGSSTWGDYDNDGDLDILITGRTQASARISQVYRNDTGTFTDASANFTGVDLGSVAWGDFDNDNDLDILLAGRDPVNTFIARVIRNDGVIANTIPSAPINLTSTVGPSAVTFSWSAATDTQTPANGLSYNLRVGTTPGGSDVFSPMANVTTGLRRVASRGPIHGTSFTLQNPPAGKNLYWSVQAVDAAFAGGAFAGEALVEAPSLMVTTAQDVVASDGLTSLREAITLANARAGADTITFSSLFASAQTITLGGSQLPSFVDAATTTVAGPGANLLTINGDGKSRIAQVASGASVVLTGLTMTGGNAAGNLGGAVYSDGNLTIRDSVLGNNSAGEGGAIQSVGTLTIETSALTGNSSGFNGGALRLFGTTIIRGSTLAGNNAANQGGALINFGAQLIIENSTIADNDKDAVLIWDGAAEVTNSTIAYNRNGGLSLVSASPSTVRNTIVAGNTGGDLLIFGAPLSAGSGNNFINLSASAAGLGSLGNYGGPTQTIPLLPNSPAINAGNSTITTDQRGLPRVGAPDIGAFESQLTPTLVSAVSINGGATQRSRVTELAVTFNQPLVTVGSLASAFALTRSSDGKQPTLNASANGNTVTLTFVAGDAVEFGSLADGRYTLSILADQVTDGFDGDGNSIPGDNYSLVGSPPNGLFRLFGDATGDGQVDASDFLAFRLAYLQPSAAAVFDATGDGQVDDADFLRFRLNFLAAV